MLPVYLYAGTGNELVHDRKIVQFLKACRAEQNIPPLTTHHDTHAYSVSKHNGNYVIGINIQLRYAAYFSDQELEQAEKILEQVKTWITRYYKAYGLHMDIHLEHAHFNRASSNPHPMPQTHGHVIYIRRDTGHHMKKTYWGINRDWDFEQRARLIAHEFSHLLQLKDEYLTTIGAQSRQEEAGYEDDSLMKNAGHPEPKLYLRHIQQILSPLCRPAKVLVAQESATDLPLP